MLNRLVDNGNTVLVIEHNLDVIKTADWIIDLGPEGGSGGGEIIAAGTPEEVAKNPRSFTGQHVKPLLERDKQLRAAAARGNGSGGTKRAPKRPADDDVDARAS